MNGSTDGVQGHHGVKGLRVAPAMSLFILEDCHILGTKFLNSLRMIRILGRECAFLEKVKDVAQIMFLCIILNVTKQFILRKSGERILSAGKISCCTARHTEEATHSADR